MFYLVNVILFRLVIGLARSAFDAALSESGDVVDVSGGEFTSFDEEDFDAQQHECDRYEEY